MLTIIASKHANKEDKRGYNYYQCDHFVDFPKINLGRASFNNQKVPQGKVFTLWALSPLSTLRGVSHQIILFSTFQNQRLNLAFVLNKMRKYLN